MFPDRRTHTERQTDMLDHNTPLPYWGQSKNQFKGQLVLKNRKETNGRTNTTDRITFPAVSSVRSQRWKRTLTATSAVCLALSETHIRPRWHALTPSDDFNVSVIK